MNGIGLGAFAGSSTTGESAYDLVGSDWSRQRQAESGAYKQEMQSLLLKFAEDHASELYSDASFGSLFIELLTLADLDAMALTITPTRGNTAYNDQDFLNRLGVRIIEACVKSQGWNGGLLPVAHLIEQLNSSAIGSVKPVTVEDVVAAINLQAELGPGIELITLPNGQKVIQTTAHELSSEQGDVLAACDVLGYVTVPMLVDNFSWTCERCERVLEQMVSGGLLWIDLETNPTGYWSPGVL